MSRIVTGQTATGSNKITQRFGKLGLTITVTGSTDIPTVLGKIDDVSVALYSRHPTYSKKEYAESGNLLKRLELNALLNGPIEMTTGGGNTTLVGELLVPYPKETRAGQVLFGGNVEFIPDEEFFVDFSDIPAGVAITLDAIELPGGKATVYVQHKYTKVFGDLFTKANVKGASYVGVDRAKLTDIRLNYGAGVQGGARQLMYSTGELAFLENDNKLPIYIIDGIVSNHAKYYYLVDVMSCESVDVKYNADGLVELINPVA